MNTTNYLLDNLFVNEEQYPLLKRNEAKFEQILKEKLLNCEIKLDKEKINELKRLLSSKKLTKEQKRMLIELIDEIEIQLFEKLDDYLYDKQERDGVYILRKEPIEVKMLRKGILLLEDTILIERDALSLFMHFKCFFELKEDRLELFYFNLKCVNAQDYKQEYRNAKDKKKMHLIKILLS